jgi:TRAP-type C4-dicarboxylate transport system permease small subunit
LFSVFVAIVLYVGATIASAVEYNMTEAAGLPIDGPPAVSLLAGSIAIGLGIAALALLVLAWILRKATRRNITTSS